MNENHSHKDKNRVTLRVGGDPLVDDLVNSTPQADKGFQRELEERLVNLLYQPKENETMTPLVYEQREMPTSRIPLTLAASLLVLILLGTLVNRPSSGDGVISGAQADLRETEMAIQATQTAIAREQALLAQSQAANETFAYGGHVMNLERPDVVLEVMRRAGMSWVKVHIQEPSFENYGEVERAIQTAHDYGMRILITVAGSAEAIQNEDFISAYANYVATVARRGADAIEIWNEPNIDRSWPTGEISGAAYVELLKPAYEAIKAANPNTLVISAAPAPTGAEASFPTMVKNDDNWLREVVAAGGLDYLDCVGVHYNEGVVAPDQLQGDPRDNTHRRYLGSMVAAYREVTLEQKPLCFTEIGYLTPEELGELSMPFAWAQNTSLDEQATWLAQAIELTAQSGMVRLMIVWNVNFTNYGESPDAGFAIIRPDGRCPACEKLAALQSLLPTPAVSAEQTAACAVSFNGPSMVSIYVAPSTGAEVIAQVAPSWSVDALEHQAVDGLSWYRVEVGANTASVVGWVPGDVLLHTEECPLSGDPTTPEGTIVFSFPLAQIMYNDDLNEGDLVDVMATLVFIRGDAPNMLIPMPLEALDKGEVSITRVIEDAHLLKINTVTDVVDVAVLPEQVEILTWLMGSRVPITLVASEP